MYKYTSINLMLIEKTHLPDHSAQKSPPSFDGGLPKKATTLRSHNAVPSALTGLTLPEPYKTKNPPYSYEGFPKKGSISKVVCELK